MKLQNILSKIETLIFSKKNKIGVYGASYLKKSMKNELESKLYSKNKIKKIHKKGFLVENWKVSKINETNYKEYLSDIDYWKMHPINGRYSHWIDDKLTLKYMLAGNSKLRRVMPDYYWHIDDEGNLFPLLDFRNRFDLKDEYEKVLELLKEKQNLALKLISGSLGEGFYKFSYLEGKIFINNTECSKEDTLSFLKKLKGYLITEFLKPNKFFSKYYEKTTNTIRYLSGRLDNEVVLLKGFVRFGTIKSNFVDNYNAGGVLCYFDENGNFENGHILGEDFSDNNLIVHPDTNEVLKGTLPDFEKMKMIAEEIHKYLPQLKYCGIDFVYTDKDEYKILEINSLTSLDSLQLEGSILKSKYGKFFKR